MKNRIIKSTLKKIELYGFKKFTINEIALDLKISKKTIYKYFESKEQIVDEVIDFLIEQDKDHTELGIKNSIKSIEKLQVLMSYYSNYKIRKVYLDELQKFYPKQWDKVELFREYRIKLISKVIDEGKKNGEFSEDINVSILNLIIDEAMLKFLDYRFLNNNNLTFNDALKNLKNILFKGILRSRID